jgi:iron(III) transport system permease protein
MAHPLALSASTATRWDAVRTIATAGTLLVLSAFTVWPLAGVMAHGAVGPVAWLPGLALQTLAVALASALVVSMPAALVAIALLRVDIPGRASLWRVFQLTALIPGFIAPLALLVLAGPHGSLKPEGLPAGLVAIIAGQALAVLPVAIALAAHALAGVPVELEHAAELLGASRLTILRRVTLGLAGPRLMRASLLVVGLCLADVASPLLLGGERLVLSTAVITAAATSSTGAAGPALALMALAVTVGLTGTVWRESGFVGFASPRLPRLERPAGSAVRWMAGGIVWVAAAFLLAPPAIVAIASLGHWSALTGGTGAAALGSSVVLGVGAAVAGTALALAIAPVVERRRGAAGRAAQLLARVPAVVPGIVIAVGHAAVTGPAASTGAGALALAIAIVATWELPVTVRAARMALVRADRSREEAAGSLGASGATILGRIVVPALSPVAGRMAAHLFAAGVLALGTVVILTAVRPVPGAIVMLDLAAAGAGGAACAVAVALLALAGGALLLGRAIGARRLDPTMLT